MKKHTLWLLNPQKMKKQLAIVLAISFICSIPVVSLAQVLKVSIKKKDVSIETVLQELEKKSGYAFFYNDNRVKLNAKVSVDVTDAPIETVLDQIFKGTGYSYKIVDNQIVISSVRSSQNQAAPSSQQQKSQVVKGVVKDIAGESVIGASIIEKGTASNGTVTDIDGNFSLTVASGQAEIEISCVGYRSQRMKVVIGKPMRIVMQEDLQALDEIVVVGYGSQKKANLTGAVASIKMDEIIGDRPLGNLGEALQGTVPGLLVSSGGNDPGKGKSFQIRGAYSVGIKNDNGSYGAAIKPLVLIDNVEGDMDMINPEDIETVTVLKDAASAAIYGARAAGGVILITTKRPAGSTSFQLNYNNNFGFANAINLPKQAPLIEYLQAYSDAAGDQFWTQGTPSVKKWMGYLEQYKKDPSSITTVGDGIFKDTDGAVYYLNEKDLAKDMLTSSFQMTHNISAAGGTDKLRYRISGSYLSNDGVLITDKDKYTRMNVSSFIAADITKWFTQEATFSYAHSNKTLPSSALGAIYSTRLASYYPQGNMPEGISDVATGLPFFTGRNQILWSNPAKTLTDNPRIFLKSIFKPLKGLEVAFEYTFDKNLYDYHWYTGSTQYTTVQGGKDITPTNDYLRKTKRYTDYNAFNLYATYDFAFAKHKFKAMVGFNQESSYMEEMDAYSYGQAVVEVPSLGSGTSTIKVTDGYNEYAVRGGFFRLNYNYQDRYLMEVNGRYDGSSKFPKDSRYGFFPSVSMGWNIAQEKFMESAQNWLGSLKVRASYGMIGNQNVPPYSFIPTMTVNNKYNGWLSNGTQVTAITSIPNLVSSSFTWEKVGTTDLGLDFSMLNNRLSGTFDWYQRDTKGMLAPGMQLPAVVGASAPYQNTADMRTRGWELSVNWRDRIGKLNYRVGFNLSDSQSKITKYDSNTSSLLSSELTNPKDNTKFTFWNFYEGKNLGEIWGYAADGFYTVDDFKDTSSWILKDGIAKPDNANPRPGDLKFQNLRDDEKGQNLITSGDNTLTNPGDRKVIGNTTPRYLYGITIGAGYAGFDLNIFMQGTGKRDAWLDNNLTFPMYSDFKFIPLYEGLNNYWRPVDAAAGDYTCANPDAQFPRIYGNYGNQSSNYRRSDKYLSDASYFRIKNVTLSYTVPKTLVSKISLQNLKFFISVENLATFSSLSKGIDPETLEWNYPAFRTVSFGLNLTL